MFRRDYPDNFPRGAAEGAVVGRHENTGIYENSRFDYQKRQRVEAGKREFDEMQRAQIIQLDPTHLSAPLGKPNTALSNDRVTVYFSGFNLLTYF